MRVKIIFSLFLLIIPLTSCKNNSSNFNKNGKVVFTEFINGNSMDDRCIEITNISNENVSLKDYLIEIYKPSSNTPYQIINFDDKQLLSNASFVISNNKSNNEILNKTNLVIDNLMVDGTWPVVLKENGKVIDTLGQLGYQIDYGRKCDLVRKKEYFIGREILRDLDWIKYSQDDYTHLGNIDVISETVLLNGPKLTNEILSLPYVNENGMGGGGVLKVTVSSLGDGDTTYFNYPNTYKDNDIYGSQSTRYLRINTPEISHGSNSAQPWGYAAKTFNNNILRNAKHIYVQSEKNYVLRETYGRLLGYVWYSNEENPKIDEYICLNFQLLKEGYAHTYFSEETIGIDSLAFNGISYNQFFLQAEKYAEESGLRVHGQKDPNFNY